MTDSANEPDSYATGGKPLKSLFNALSMAKKYGRDALICAGVYTGISLASGGGGDMLNIDPIINLTAISLLTAVFTSIGRYAGGAMGYGLDRAYDSHKKNPPLTTSFGRKSLAGIGGVAAGAAFATALTLSLMVMGMKSAENNSVDPAGKQILVSNPVAQTRAPLAKI